MNRIVGGFVAMLLCGPVGLAAVFTGPGAAAPETPSGQAIAEIPADLLAVYRAAAITCPGLPWTVLAAIGWVESHHAGGHADPLSGAVDPPIIGPPLDGTNGTATIPDPSQPDGWAHAVGAMQFLPTTWTAWAVLAPDRPTPEAAPDPQNAWDAIYTAARYLCGGLERLDDVDAALRRYNHSDAFVDHVLARATAYGLGSPSSSFVEDAVPGSVGVVIAAAMSQLGVPYRWGAQAPGVAFDCSGLVQWAFAQAGVALPRTTAGQVLSGVSVQFGDLRPGDLVFTTSVREGQRVIAGHVAIYVGGGQVVVAPRTGDVIKSAALEGSLDAARRVIG